MTRSTKLFPAAFLVFALCACVAAPKIIQGTVISYDPASKVIVIRDECPPNPEITLSVSGAEIGASPQVNDMVRALYMDDGGRLAATRLMNLTRQKEAGTLARQETGKKCKAPADK